jgi:hypothetical protein
LKKEDLIAALGLPKLKSDQWKIFEISALTGKSPSINILCLPLI